MRLIRYSNVCCALPPSCRLIVCLPSISQVQLISLFPSLLPSLSLSLSKLSVSPLLLFFPSRLPFLHLSLYGFPSYVSLILFLLVISLSFFYIIILDQSPFSLASCLGVHGSFSPARAYHCLSGHHLSFLPTLTF